MVVVPEISLARGNNLCPSYLPSDLSSVSQADLKVEQQAYPSLKKLFDHAVTSSKLGKDHPVYVLHRDLLTKRWIPPEKDLLGLCC